MPQTLPQILSDLQSQIDDLSAGLVAVPRGPGSVKNSMIAPNSVQATNINVQKLAAVSSETGSLSVTGDLTMTGSGVFSAGQTAYNTGTGWWLEGNSGTPRFSLGNSSGQHLTWDGTSLSVTGVITMNDTTGSFGTVCIFQHSGVTTGSIFCPTSSSVVFSQGTSLAQGAALSLGLSDWGLTTVGAAQLRSTGNDFQSTGKFFPGSGLAFQATRGISDNGFQTEFSGGIKLGGTILMGSGNTGTSGSGALPSPTKWIEFLDSSGNPYIVPAYSQHSPWTV